MNRLSKEYTTTNNKEKVKAQYTYGKTGGVTLITNDTSAIANKYDNKGLISEQKLFEDGKSYAMVYGNNANGKCVYSKIYNNNTGHYGDYDIQQMINYEYDAKGNMTTVSDSLNNSKVMARYTYDSNDNLSSVTYGNGTSTSYTYNKGNMIEKVINNNADNTQMSIYSYDYYLDGNVSKQNRNGVKCYYDYDEFSRITDEDYGREEIDYYYDAAGNRTLKKICDDNGDTDVNYTYDLNNRLLEESTNYYSKNEIDVTKYVYDNNGNQIKKIGYITKDVNGSPSQDLVSENELNNTYEIYKYNEFNEMTSFESNKESKWEYAYLPNGLRYRKSNASNFDRFVWDRNGNIIAEMNGDGELTNKYVRGNKLIYKNGDEYYSYDGHGSVVNISNESGKSVKSYDYDAFGVELNKDANDTNLFRYCGEQYDNETDSIYLRARYYSPSLGRFTTEDPAKDGDNWYSYCAGNPVNGWDPSGLTEEGDENLSQAAQKYIAYYTNLWETANNNYINAENDSDRNNALLAMKDAHDKAENIRELDKQNKVSGVFYEVPLYRQGMYSLCWAFSQTMIESYENGEKLSSLEATKRAITIAKQVNGTDYNRGGWPTNADISNILEIDSSKDLEKILNSGPAYGYYSNEDVEAAHLVVITGIYSASGHDCIVSTNNQWGSENIQSYNDFKSGIPGDTSGMTFKFALKIKH